MHTHFGHQVFQGPGELPLATKLMVSFDRDKYIAGWYLPHVFTSDQSVSLKSRITLNQAHNTLLDRPTYSSPSTNWACYHDLFLALMPRVGTGVTIQLRIGQRVGAR